MIESISYRMYTNSHDTKPKVMRVSCKKQSRARAPLAKLELAQIRAAADMLQM